MASATDIKADINKTYRCVSETQVNMDSVTVTLRDATIQAYLSSSNFSREGEDPAEAPAPTVGKVPSSLRVGSSRVQGKAGGPSAFVMEWMGSGRRSPHRGLAHHSPTQAGGPRVPLRKTASSSCEVTVLASRESWGPRSLREYPGHCTARCLLLPTPHILPLSSQVTITAWGEGGIPPPCSMCQPCLVAQSGRVLDCLATPWPSLWPAAGLGPPVSSGAARPSGLCTAKERRLLFVIRNLRLKKKSKDCFTTGENKVPRLGLSFCREQPRAFALPLPLLRLRSGARWGPAPTASARSSHRLALRGACQPLTPQARSWRGGG